MSYWSRDRWTQAGFTIIEVLMVLAIVGILALLVLSNINQSLAKARDIERRTDINAIQTALENYYHQHQSYPTNLDELDINEENLIDPSGNRISVSTALTTDNKPAAPYTDVQSPEAEYTYAGFDCQPAEAGSNQTNSQEEADSIENVNYNCNQYVLYAWQETAEVSEVNYERSNLHQAPAETEADS